MPPQRRISAAAADGRHHQLAELQLRTRRLVEALKQVPKIVAPDAELLDGGLEARLVIDRDKASRLGVDMAQIDNTLYDAFGQRQVTTIIIAFIDSSS